MRPPPVDGAPRRGRVTRFDEEAGLGWLEAADDGPYRFHCTQIADGSRRIVEGTNVWFVVRPGRLGEWEAGEVRPLTPESPAGDPPGPGRRPPAGRR